MKCIVTADHNSPPLLENEAEGFKMRVNAEVINGVQRLGQLSLEVVVPFASSSTQMEGTVRTRVRDEFLRTGVNIATNDIKLLCISIA